MADGAAQTKAAPTDDSVPDTLLWVKDAPLFIDEDTLARFYDAVVRPAFKENTPLKIKISEAQKKELEGKLGGKAKFGLSAWISHILGAEVEVSAEGKAGEVVLGKLGAGNHARADLNTTTTARAVGRVLPPQPRRTYPLRRHRVAAAVEEEGAER